MMMRLPRLRRLTRDRRGVAAIVFALGGMAFMMIIGLAVDFAGAIALKTKLDLAADAGLLAGITAAATNLGPNPGSYLQLGQQAGTTRFLAQAGQSTPPSSSITLTRSGSTIVGQLTYTASYRTFFGALYGQPTWSISGTAGSSVLVSAPYLNVEILLDNSPSMEIAASNTDIQTMQQLTPCSASGAYYWVNGAWSQIAPASGQSYNAYACSAGGYTYNGGLPCPIPANSPYTFSSFSPTGNAQGPSCQGWLPLYNGKYPEAGAPCAFACHFDTSKPAGTGSDYYAVARGTIGQSNQITLRFDLVKSAVNQMITTMQADNLVINNLNVGIWTFASSLTRVYPSSGEAGNNWATAISDVGEPPTSPKTADTGIQPYAGGNDADTDFPDTMASLASELTAAGDGTTAASPKKVLVIITDGVDDYVNSGGTRILSAIDPTACNTFKNMGYTVYVLYTPYYPLMNAFYLENMYNLVSGTGSTSITYNLQQCATSSSDYIAASDSASIAAALQTFLKQALNTQARLTQ